VNCLAGTLERYEVVYQKNIELIEQEYSNKISSLSQKYLEALITLMGEAKAAGNSSYVDRIQSVIDDSGLTYVCASTAGGYPAKTAKINVDSDKMVLDDCAGDGAFLFSALFNTPPSKNNSLIRKSKYYSMTYKENYCDILDKANKLVDLSLHNTISIDVRNRGKKQIVGPVFVRIQLNQWDGEKVIWGYRFPVEIVPADGKWHTVAIPISYFTPYVKGVIPTGRDKIMSLVFGLYTEMKIDTIHFDFRNLVAQKHEVGKISVELSE
jgi:hypothetical protein